MRSLALLLALSGLCGPCLASTYSLWTVQQIAQDFYQINGSNTFVMTRFCYDLSIGTATLVIDQPGGYNIGKILFSDGQVCNVAMVLVPATIS